MNRSRANGSGRWSVVSGQLFLEHGTATLRSRRSLRSCVERCTVAGGELRVALLQNRRVALISKRLQQLGGERITSDFGISVRSHAHGRNRRTP